MPALLLARAGDERLEHLGAGLVGGRDVAGLLVLEQARRRRCASSARRRPRPRRWWPGSPLGDLVEHGPDQGGAAATPRTSSRDRLCRPRGSGCGARRIGNSRLTRMYANPGLGTEGYCDGAPRAAQGAVRPLSLRGACRRGWSRWRRDRFRAGPRRCSPRTARGRTSAAAAGSGIFGHWFVDGFGLPAYRYRLDPDRDPRTRQPELNGSTDAWHQLGNDHIVATAHTRGHVQLWSQDPPTSGSTSPSRRLGQYAGGYGYLRTAGGRVISTLYADRPGRRAHRARLRHRLLRPLDGAPGRRDRAGLRALRRRPAAAPRRHDPQQLAPPRARQLDRVLGRQPAQRGQHALHRARAPGLRPPRADALGRPAARRASTSGR